MQHKCKVTVLRRELFRDLQEKYLANPESGKCPFYKDGQEFLFERYGDRDDFWTEGNGSHCAEAWDCISRYIYTALQGGSIMRKWTNDDKIMIACCNDGTRPVIFKIERIDYKVLYIKDFKKHKEDIKNKLSSLENVTDTIFKDNFTEITIKKDFSDDIIKKVLSDYKIEKID